ncbi:MAG TPA: hypothetical protein VI932_11185 [Bacteroidota bacterium]|nr:hypothetical protein [Bacteroidota bacterium]
MAPGLYSLYIVVRICGSGPEFRIQYLPDDAFYYLTLARNFVLHGTWTFDSGISVTTGFHLLHAYSLAGIYWLLGSSSPEAFIRSAVIATYLVGTIACILGGVVVYRSRRILPAVFFAVVILSRNVSLGSISVVEWPWVITLSAAYFFLVDQLSSRGGITMIILLFICGLLGSLARSDFGLMPLALAVSVVVSPGITDKRRHVIGTLSGLAGAGFGIAVITGHNYVIGGSLVQSSAQMKYFWNTFYGPSAKPILRTVLSLFGTPSVLTVTLFCLLFLLFMTAGLILFMGHRGREVVAGQGRIRRALWGGSVLTVAGYVLFYSFNASGIQQWYTAHLVVPLFFIGVIPMLYLRDHRPLNSAWAILLTLMVLFETHQARMFFSTPEWPHQQQLYRAGGYLKTARLDSGVGSWNAGILGFYTDGGVVNLDGLVNNSIYSYASRNDLPTYIDSIPIGYIIDFMNMFEGERIRARGGYDRPDFIERLKPLKRFDEGGNGWSRLTLYKILPTPEIDRFSGDRP